MQILNIKFKKKSEKPNWLFLTVVLFICILPLFANYEIPPYARVESHSPLDMPERVERPRVVAYDHVRKSEASGRIVEAYERVGSPIADKVPWVVAEAEQRGLDPYLVLAVMAKESGWGRHCHKGNCFGYGATDSGNIDKWFPGDFEVATEMILDSYEQYYKVDTAEEMAARGYNFHDEWVVGVNIIRGYF